MYLQFVTVIIDCNLIFFAVQMCFKRGDISNLMEKLVGWKSTPCCCCCRMDENINVMGLNLNLELGWQMGYTNKRKNE